MKLPNSDKAFIASEKLSDYLLSDTHPLGRLKAKFFQAIGFDKTTCAALEQQLLNIAQISSQVSKIASAHGDKYLVDGIITSPRGMSAHIRTVWIVESPGHPPRFVTAYPV